MSDLLPDRGAQPGPAEEPVARPPVIVKRRLPFRPAVEGEAWRDDPWDDTEAMHAHVVERERRSRWPFKVVAYTALVLGVAAILVAGSIGWWYIQRINPEGDPGAPVNFTIEADDTLESVSERLELEGLISDASVFRWYVERQGGLDLTPGYYQIRPSDHMGNVMHALGTPPELTYRQVTFPEGFTLSKMANRLSEEVPRLTYAEYVAAATDGSIVSEYSQFAPAGTTSLEGLLFPDTYQVSNGESAADVVQRQVELMERVGRQEQIVEKGYALALSAYEVLVIASMVEREAKTDADRPMVARVIINRLHHPDRETYPAGMPLQIDATLFYGQDADASVSQLKLIDSPYNTYMYAGLPPTPIANPGRASIEAVLNPAVDPPEGGALCKTLPKGECHWYYYVLSPEGDGSHVFAVTLAQHEANVEAAREAGVL
jgi:UPF0755 protein